MHENHSISTNWGHRGSCGSYTPTPSPPIRAHTEHGNHTFSSAPGSLFLSGWNLRASFRYAFLIWPAVAV